jgi:hypothetical protein
MRDVSLQQPEIEIDQVRPTCSLTYKGSLPDRVVVTSQKRCLIGADLTLRTSPPSDRKIRATSRFSLLDIFCTFFPSIIPFSRRYT